MTSLSPKCRAQCQKDHLPKGRKNKAPVIPPIYVFNIILLRLDCYLFLNRNVYTITRIQPTVKSVMKSADCALLRWDLLSPRIIRDASSEQDAFFNIFMLFCCVLWFLCSSRGSILFRKLADRHVSFIL